MNAAEIFRTEANELLADIEECILELENSPEDADSVNRLFRAMHTIKGSGAMFGFDAVADFTHHFETAMDKVRNGEISVSTTLIDLTLKSHDHILYLFECSDDGTAPDTSVGDAILKELAKIIPETGSTPDGLIGTDNALEEADAAQECTYRIKFKPHAGFFATGSEPCLLLEELNDLGHSSAICRSDEVPALDSLKAEECYLFWNIVLTTTQSIDDIKDVFIFVEDDCDLSIELIDDQSGENHRRIGEILLDHGEINQEALKETLKKQKPIGELLVENNIVHPQALEAALQEQQQVKQVQTKRKKEEKASTIRVDAGKLDALVDLVGELVTVQARLTEKTMSSKDPDLGLIAEEIERLTSGLRDETMSVRMLQIGSTFNSFKRLVRDLSGTLGKEIHFQTSGGETELDKTVIEQLKDPLVHIIRNSVDHGIEDTQTRIDNGKDKAGTIHISAVHSGAQVHISIQDDGAGLNSERILAKAIERGIVTPDQELTQSEINYLIFAPGFSTAEEVSELSGRGVGMDVVKQNIESLRGSIDIESTPGEGTRITLKLPLTLAIIDGLMIMIEDDYYILPLSSVEECLEISRADVDKVKGRNIINLRGEAVPYVELRERFDIKTPEPEVQQVVITEIDDKRIGFVVDRVIGGHQTVIKSLGRMLRNSEYVSGATILGDGTVALILAVNKLL